MAKRQIKRLALIDLTHIKLPESSLIFRVLRFLNTNIEQGRGAQQRGVILLLSFALIKEIEINLVPTISCKKIFDRVFYKN